MRANTGGIVLIIIGVVLLLNNLGVLDWDFLWKFWPVILIAAGVMMLFPRKSEEKPHEHE